MSSALLLVVSCLWGSSFLVIERAAASFSALGIAAIRVTVAGLALGIVVRLTRQPVPSDMRTWTLLIALAGLGQVLPFFLLGLSGHLTTSGNAALMMAVSPLVTVVLGTMVDRSELPRGTAWFGPIVGLGGVALIMFAESGASSSWQQLSGGDILGKTSALGAALGFAAGAVLVRHIAASLSPVVIAYCSLATSAVVLWTAALILRADIASHVTPEALTAVLALGALNTALAYGTYFTLIRIAGPTFASLNNYLVPVIGLAAGHLLLAETFRWISTVGLGLILGSVWLTSKSGSLNS